MCKDKYPAKIKAWPLLYDGKGSGEPAYTEIIYNKTERDSFNSFIKSQKINHQLKEYRPKLKELKEYKWYKKMWYLLPFRTEIDEAIGEFVKLAIGFGLGWLATRIPHI